MDKGKQIEAYRREAKRTLKGIRVLRGNLTDLIGRIKALGGKVDDLKEDDTAK